MNGDDNVTAMLNRAGRRQLERLREQQLATDSGNPIADDPRLHALLTADVERQLLERYDALVGESTDPDTPRALFHDVAGFMAWYVLSGAAMRAVSVK